MMKNKSALPGAFAFWVYFLGKNYKRQALSPQNAKTQKNTVPLFTFHMKGVYVLTPPRCPWRTGAPGPHLNCMMKLPPGVPGVQGPPGPTLTHDEQKSALPGAFAFWGYLFGKSYKRPS